MSNMEELDHAKEAVKSLGNCTGSEMNASELEFPMEVIGKLPNFLKCFTHQDRAIAAGSLELAGTQHVKENNGDGDGLLSGMTPEILHDILLKIGNETNCRETEFANDMEVVKMNSNENDPANLLPGVHPEILQDILFKVETDKKRSIGMPSNRNDAFVEIPRLKELAARALEEEETLDEQDVKLSVESDENISNQSTSGLMDVGGNANRTLSPYDDVTQPFDVPPTCCLNFMVFSFSAMLILSYMVLFWGVQNTYIR